MVALLAPQGAFATCPCDHGTLMVVRLEHPLNAEEWMVFGFPSNVILVSPVQLANTPKPMFVIPGGSLVIARLRQPLNA